MGNFQTKEVDLPHVCKGLIGLVLPSHKNTIKILEMIFGLTQLKGSARFDRIAFSDSLFVVRTKLFNANQILSNQSSI
jgi:hypothetical protein